MLLQRLTAFVLQSRLHAMGSAFVLSLIPLGGTVSVLIAGLVTLRKNVLEGFLVLFTATLPYLIYMARPPSELPLVDIFVEIIVVSNVLTWVFAVMLRQYGSWTFTLEFAALLGILIISTVHLLYPNVQNWWGDQLTNYYKVIAERGDNVAGAISPETQEQIVAVVKSYATGFVVAMLLLISLLQLLLARWWQAAVFNPGGLGTELRNIKMGYAAAGFFMAGLLLSYFDNAVVIEIMPIIYMTFCAAGLSLIHVWVARKPSAWTWLGFVYLGLFLVFPYSMVLIAMLALVDTFVDFRKRLVKPK